MNFNYYSRNEIEIFSNERKNILNYQVDDNDAVQKINP